MGYQIRTIDGQITIPLAKHEGAAVAIADALGYPHDYRSHEVLPELGENFATPATQWLIDLLSEIGFKPDEAFDAEPGTLAIDFFNGKATFSSNGEDDELTATAKALAGFAAAGSYLIWLGEEGETWRWIYTEDEFFEQTPQIIWPEIPAKSEA